MSWFAIATVAIFALLMWWTRTGRAFYAVGGNPTAAVYTGIDVGRTQFISFCISGLLAGFCGYVWVSRYTIAYVDIAGGFELEVIAACVIGGVSIAGGIGTVAGVVLGSLFLGVVKNALPVIHVSPFWQLAISGAAILGAVVINAGRERRTGRLILKEAAAP
jgi:rhamnose transport system permease protein